MSEEQMNDSTFGRLFILLVVATSLLLALLMVLATFTAGDVNARLDERSEQENSGIIASRIAKVGEFAVQTAAAETPATAAVPAAKPEALSGEEAYASCAACHGAGIAGAPMVGNAEAWAPRITQGLDKLTEHAINGYQGDSGFMPAKGGNPSLSDESVRAAVQYMVDAVK